MHIMLDLETLSTANNAVVLSIGAVAFNAEGEMGEKFYMEMTNDLESQITRGRAISAKTVIWWMQQNALAKQVFAEHCTEKDVRYPTDIALGAFSEFVARNGGKEAEIWGNGSDFDNAILSSLFTAYGMPIPWMFYNNRCYRTLKKLPGVPNMRERMGAHHNALDDAITQAIHLQEIFAWLDRH